MSTLLANAAIWAAVVTALLGLGSYYVRSASEAKSTKRAILAEIDRLLDVVKRHIEIWEGYVKDKTTGHHPLIPFSHAVYDEQVKNVGRIRRELVAQVVQFYGYVGYLNDLQALRDKYDAAGHSAEFNEIYLDSLKRLIADFGESFRCAIDHEDLRTKHCLPVRH